MQGKIFIIGYDSGQAQMDAIRSGEEAGAITQDPIGIGYKSVEAAVKTLNGVAVPKTIDTGSTGMTRLTLMIPSLPLCSINNGFQ